MKIDQSLDFFDPAEGNGRRRKGYIVRYRRPSKENVRDWLVRVIESRRPPPSIADIQSDLWQMTRWDDEGVEHDLPEASADCSAK